jgi:hypothetical protein
MDKTQNASWLENLVSGQRNTFFGWNFQDILMMIRSIYDSDENSIIWGFAQYRKNGQKFSKKPLTRLQRPSCPNPSRVILVSWYPICDRNISSKVIGQLVPLPRKLLAWLPYCIVIVVGRVYNALNKGSVFI